MDLPSDAESMFFIVMIVHGEDMRVVVHARDVPEVLAIIRARMPLAAPHVELIPEDMRDIIRERNVPSILDRLRSLVPLEPAAPAAPIPEAMLVPCEPLASDRCCICLESGSSWISLSRCHHRFHAHCIRQWLRTTCPMCRAEYAAT